MLQFGIQDISGEVMGAKLYVMKHMTDAKWQKINKVSQGWNLIIN